MDHVEIVTRHELDIRLLPQARWVGVPLDRAVCAFVEDITGARSGRDDARHDTSRDICGIRGRQSRTGKDVGEELIEAAHDLYLGGEMSVPAL